MRRWILSFVLVLVLAFGVMSSGALMPIADAAAQQVDAEIPPGNPVVGSDRPGDIEADGDTNYALWSLLAVCLIAAGSLLVTIERWESRRIEQAERPSRV